jgi:hypothetical protein
MPSRRSFLRRENLGRLTGLLFSVLIPLCPILIAMLAPPPSGGIFILGFLAGAVAVTFVVIGTIRSADALYRGTLLDSALGIAAYIVGVFVISILAATWSFYSAQ